MGANRQPTPIGELLTKEELAARLKVPLNYVIVLRKSGKIPCIRFGHRTIRFELDRVLQALRSAEVLEVGKSSSVR